MQNNSKNNALQLFRYDKNNIRTYTKDDGSIWFIAADVCRVLGLKNVTKALYGLDSDELTLLLVRAGGQKREMNAVSESGLYSLIFKSRKEEARNFSRWVRREVLPSIRQHGFYVNDEKINSLNQRDKTIKEILSELKNTREENKRLRAQIENEKPRVALADLLVSTSESVTFQEASIFFIQHGIKNIGQNNLFKLLRDIGLLCSRKGKQWNKPTAESAKKGYFCLQVSGSHNRTITMITHKFLMKLLDDFTKEQLPIVYMLEQEDK